MNHLGSVCLVISLVLLFPGTASFDVVMVRRGQPVVLQCKTIPGDTLLYVTWKLHFSNSSCITSYKIGENNSRTSYNSCSTRMRSDNLSLTISNTELSDEGTYTCEVAYREDIILKLTSLQVLAQPSTYLTLTSDGSPECGAIGGKPPAEISWFPHSDDINTTKLQDPDQTWSVISTYRREGINGTSVTCVVSHPTLENPWTKDITLGGKGFILRFDNIVRISVTAISTVLMAGLFLYLRIKRQVQNIPAEQIYED